MRSSFPAMAAFLWILVIPAIGSAHPHVFIDARASLEAKADGSLKAIHIFWRFDPLFSSDLMSQFDTDKNGSLSQEEYAAMGKSVLPNLKEFGYFTHLQQGKEKILLSPEDFTASFTDKRMHFEMRLIPEKPVPLKGSGISIAFYDESYYVDVAIEKGLEEVPLKGADISCKSHFFDDKENLYYYGVLAPRTVSVKC